MAGETGRVLRSGSAVISIHTLYTWGFTSSRRGRVWSCTVNPKKKTEAKQLLAPPRNGKRVSSWIRKSAVQVLFFLSPFSLLVSSKSRSDEGRGAFRKQHALLLASEKGAVCRVSTQGARTSSVSEKIVLHRVQCDRARMHRLPLATRSHFGNSCKVTQAQQQQPACRFSVTVEACSSMLAS